MIDGLCGMWKKNMYILKFGFSWQAAISSENLLCKKRNKMLDLPTEASPSRTSLKPFRGIRAAASPYDMAASYTMSAGRCGDGASLWCWLIGMLGMQHFKDESRLTKHESKGVSKFQRMFVLECARISEKVTCLLCDVKKSSWYHDGVCLLSKTLCLNLWRMLEWRISWRAGKKQNTHQPEVVCIMILGIIFTVDETWNINHMKSW